MGQDKTMRGGDEDPILWPRLAPLPSLSQAPPCLSPKITPTKHPSYSKSLIFFLPYFLLSLFSLQKNVALGSIWLDGWKTGRMKNGEGIEKWENKRDLVFTHVGKFRPRLIELTSFKLKLLIRFIMNKHC